MPGSISTAAAGLHHHKIADNSSEARPCSLPPHVLQVLLFISCCTQVLQNLLQQRSVCVCVCVRVCVCARVRAQADICTIKFVPPGYHFKSSFGFS